TAAAGTCVDVHNAELCPPERSRQPGAAIDGNLLPGYRVDPDLTAEKQLILVTDVKVKHARIFEKELPFLWDQDFERRDIEGLKIDIGIGKIGITGEIQHHVGAEAILNVQSAGDGKSRVLPGLPIIPGQAVGLDDEEPSAADIADTA